MKRFTLLIALLAMVSLLAVSFTACGSSESEAPAESNAVSGNWYIVEDDEISTLKLDAAGGGSLSGDAVAYELSDESLTLTIDSEDLALTIAEDAEYGTVLKDGDDIYAYRDKNVAKEVAQGGGSNPYEAELIGTWYLIDGEEVTPLTFKEDGTAESAGVVVDYTLNEDTVTLSSDGDTYDLIIAEDSTEGWVLKETYGDIAALKDKAKAEAKVAAAAPKEEQKEETKQETKEDKKDESKSSSSSTKTNKFIGTWDGDTVDYQGTTFTMEDAGMTFSVEIKDDGTMVAMTNGESDGSADWTLNDDGTLSIKDVSGDLPEPAYIDDSGKLHLALQGESGTMWFILHKR